MAKIFYIYHGLKWTFMTTFVPENIEMPGGMIKYNEALLVNIYTQQK